MFDKGFKTWNLKCAVCAWIQASFCAACTCACCFCEQSTDMWYERDTKLCFFSINSAEVPKEGLGKITDPLLSLLMCDSEWLQNCVAWSSVGVCLKAAGFLFESFLWCTMLVFSPLTFVCRRDKAEHSKQKMHYFALCRFSPWVHKSRITKPYTLGKTYVNSRAQMLKHLVVFPHLYTDICD